MNGGRIVARTTAETTAGMAIDGKVAMIAAVIGMTAAGPMGAIGEETIGAEMTADGVMKGAAVATSKPMVKPRHVGGLVQPLDCRGESRS